MLAVPGGGNARTRRLPGGLDVVFIACRNVTSGRQAGALSALRVQGRASDHSGQISGSLALSPVSASVPHYLASRVW
jgi:hypothetical protein